MFFMAFIKARHRVGRSLLACCAVGALAASTFGCGAQGDNSLSATAAKVLPRAAGGVVARVGSEQIDQAAYDRRFAAEAQDEEATAGLIPVPPRFEKCVAQLEASLKKLNLQMPSSSRLRGRCNALYEGLREKTLTRLIVGQWVTAAAAEEGVTAKSAQVREELERSWQDAFASKAQFRQYLVQTGLKLSDVAREARVIVLARLLRRNVLQRLGSFSRSRIKAYYKTHPELDSKPELRKIEIVRAGSVAAATRIKRKIAAGESFERAAKGLPHQPVGARNGVVPNFEHYSEPLLNHAMHAAKLHVLTGPVGLGPGFPPGWYVFRVVHVYPLRQKPFRDVEAKLLKTLPGQLRRQAVEEFESSWTERWKAKTLCAAGYETALCRQITGSTARVSIDVPDVFE